MNDKWLNDIRDKMSDFEIDEPQGLWNDINLKQFQGEDVDVGRDDVKKSIPFRIRLGIAAAIVAAVVSIGLLFVNNDIATTNPEIATMDKRIAVCKHETLLPVKTDNVEMVQTVSHPAITETILSEKEFITEKTSGDSVVISKTDRECTSDSKTLIINKTVSTGNDDNLLALNNVSDSKSGRLSVGVFTSGGLGVEQNRKSSFYSASTEVVNNKYIWKDRPLLGILAYNRNKKIASSIRHRQPVKAGVSLSFRLDDRFSIASGLSFTKLTSDIFEGSDNHYFTGEQNLFYIGIPLNISYNIYSWRKFDIYAAAGVAAEKCVYASTNRSYVINNSVIKEDKYRIKEKPLQWSVNATAGIQYNITSKLGVYIEPGAGYYFDCHSNLRTIYSDKPLNLNLNFGLRLTFDKD